VQARLILLARSEPPPFPGPFKVTEEVAAAALLDLDSDGDALVGEALVAALAVDCGAARTPSGLVLVG
jgi:hypothetical protein